MGGRRLFVVCIFTRALSSMRVRVYNRHAPIILSAMNYTRTHSRQVEQSETFRRFRVNFAVEQLVSSHIPQMNGREARTYPLKKNTRILARTLLESFHDFAVLLIRYQVLRFCHVSRYVSRVAFSFRLPFYSSMGGNLSFYRDLHF